LDGKCRGDCYIWIWRSGSNDALVIAKERVRNTCPVKIDILINSNSRFYHDTLSLDNDGHLRTFADVLHKLAFLQFQ
jgi:hypothetical protein